jgi:hypothetical protein
MAGVLSEYMAKHGGISSKINASSLALSSKRQRRTELAKVIRQLERIRDSEEGYRDRIPENLQTSAVFEAADEWITNLDEVLELLGNLP